MNIWIILVKIYEMHVFTMVDKLLQGPILFHNYVAQNWSLLWPTTFVI